MVVHPVDRQEMFFHHPVKLFTVTVPLCNISWAKQVFNLSFKPNDILLRSRCLTFPPTGVSVAMQPFKQHTTTQWTITYPHNLSQLKSVYSFYHQDPKWKLSSEHCETNRKIAFSNETFFQNRGMMLLSMLNNTSFSSRRSLELDLDIFPSTALETDPDYGKSFATEGGILVVSSLYQDQPHLLKAGMAMVLPLTIIITILLLSLLNNNNTRISLT